MPPTQVDCATPHYWETFAAIPLPADAATIRADSLIQRKDVAAACSASLMASRSRDPKATKTWERDAWPIQLPGDGAWLLHCIARPRSAEATSPAF